MRLSDSLGSAGASGFETRSGDAGDAHCASDVGSEMVLADERGSCKVAEVEGFHLRWFDVGGSEAEVAGFYCEAAQVAICECAERCFADTDHGDWSHVSPVVVPG